MSSEDFFVRDEGELAAQVELLAEENRRLRREYTRARRATHRRTAIGLGLIGVIAAVGGIIFPAGQEVLFALAATGLFGAILTVYLTPERFVAASVGERIYAALADNHEALVDELGLDRDVRYLPAGDPPGRLYAPARDANPPAPDTAGPLVVEDGSRGLLVTATGAPLLAELDHVMRGELATRPEPLAVQLADGLVEHLELAVGTDIDPGESRVTFAIDDPAYGDLTRFDHPVVSMLACGMAIGLDTATRVSVDHGDARADWLVTVRWDEDDESMV